MLLFNENPDLREYYVEAHGNDISKLSVKRKKKKKNGIIGMPFPSRLYACQLLMHSKKKLVSCTTQGCRFGAWGKLFHSLAALG